ncbi:MAG: hypothetical protein ACOZJX_12600 [Pseudomonadota bacterium]
MATSHPSPLTHQQRDALRAAAMRRAQRGRQAAFRLAWSRLGRLLRLAHRRPHATTALPLLQRKAG